MPRKDITLAGQFEKRRGWKDPLVDSVVATFLRRRVKELRVPQDEHPRPQLDSYEYLVTERKKGAETGQFQAHHGGFMKVIDVDLRHGAVREVREETGFVIDSKDLQYITCIGPQLYRSKMYLLGDSSNFVLVIGEEEAEPSVAFTLPLFLANVDFSERVGETDGEVTNGNWMTLREIIEKFGVVDGEHGHSKFNYFQYLVPLLLREFPSFEWVPSDPGFYPMDIK